jgi:hypothetical protein
MMNSVTWLLKKLAENIGRLSSLKEAIKIGETRQSLIKLWLSDKLVVHI